MHKKEDVNPGNCPLCNKPNFCGNVSNSSKPCWCMEEGVTFPESLLNQAVDTAKNNACICKICAIKHEKSQQ